MESKATRTVSLKLVNPPEALGKTIDSFAQACNYVSQIAFENNYLSRRLALHRLTYKDIRDRFPLTAQMACSVIRQDLERLGCKSISPEVSPALVGQRQAVCFS